VTGEVHAGFGGGDLMERDHFEGLGVHGTIILKWIFKQWDGSRTGLMWLMVKTGGGHL